MYDKLIEKGKENYNFLWDSSEYLNGYKMGTGWKVNISSKCVFVL